MKKAILVLLIFIFLILLLSLTVFFISRRTSFFGRAGGAPTGEAGLVSIDNSYLFASPLAAAAGNREKIRLTIFVLNSTGLGVRGEAVFLGENEKLTVTAVQPVTDDLGRAIFDVSASLAGEYLMEARVGGKVLPQRVRISFR